MSQNQCVESVEAVTKDGASVEGALYERPDGKQFASRSLATFKVARGNEVASTA